MYVNCQTKRLTVKMFIPVNSTFKMKSFPGTVSVEQSYFVHIEDVILAVTLTNRWKLVSPFINHFVIDITPLATHGPKCYVVSFDKRSKPTSAVNKKNTTIM